MLFQRNQKNNDKQPLSNFKAEIESDAKQIEAQPKNGVAYKNKGVYTCVPLIVVGGLIKFRRWKTWVPRKIISKTMTTVGRKQEVF